jgi:cytochrome c oxidase assembly factor CtaG
MGIEAMGILSEATFWRALAAAGIFLVGLVYVRGWRRLQSFHQGPPPKDAPASARSLMLFVPGLTLLAVAFVSPLGYLATQYFSARIIQHMLLVASIPSLLMLANPLPALLHGLPERNRVALLARLNDGPPGPGRRFLRWATAPGVTLLAFLCICWFWYDPLVHAATLRFGFVHALELLSLLTVGLLNWWHITAAWPHVHGRMAPIVRILYAFISIWPVKVVGLILLFVADSPYPYPQTFQFSGLDIDDAVFGAMIAWIVSGLAYAVAAVGLVNDWLAREVDKPALPEANWATDEAMIAPHIKRRP